MKYRMVAGILCVVVCGCGDAAGPQVEDGQITVRTDGSQYAPNQLIIVRTTNRTGQLVFDDHCGGEVQGYEFLEEWNASYGAGRGCMFHGPDEWRENSIAIPHGSVHVDTFHVNGRAYSGTWRVRLFLRTESGTPLPEEQSISNTFQVNGTWSP